MKKNVLNSSKFKKNTENFRKKLVKKKISIVIWYLKVILVLEKQQKVLAGQEAGFVELQKGKAYLAVL